MNHNDWAWALGDNCLIHLPSGACFERGVLFTEYFWKLMPSLGINPYGTDHQYSLVLRENLEKHTWLAVWSYCDSSNILRVDNLEHSEMFTALSLALIEMGLWTGNNSILWRDENSRWLIDYTEGNYINLNKFSFCYEFNKPKMFGGFELGFNLRIFERFRYGTFVYQEIRIILMEPATRYQHYSVCPRSNRLSRSIKDLESKNLQDLCDACLDF